MADCNNCKTCGFSFCPNGGAVACQYSLIVGHSRPKGGIECEGWASPKDVTARYGTGRLDRIGPVEAAMEGLLASGEAFSSGRGSGRGTAEHNRATGARKILGRKKEVEEIVERMCTNGID